MMHTYRELIGDYVPAVLRKVGASTIQDSTMSEADEQGFHVKSLVR
jgi:hypothetical protein